MTFFYTWHDVEREIGSYFPDKWHPKWTDVDVYADEIVFIVKNSFSEADKVESSKILKELFGQHFIESEQKIRLDYGNAFLAISYEQEVDNFEKDLIPLFKEPKRRMSKIEPLKGVQVIAFHSYKGGVGRTLSMLAMARSLSQLKRKDGKSPFRLLLIDGDIEAPGLTWLALKRDMSSDISLLDALSIVHETDAWREDALPFIAKKIQETMLRLPVGNQEVEHYFLPTYRNENQVTSMPITPENLVSMIDRKWILAEFLSELGEYLEVDAVLIDLRAGVSEFAAPLLFDPRVKKVFVTSTSLQSRCGLQTVLRQIYFAPLEDCYPGPVVLVSMVPEELKKAEMAKIEVEFLEIEAEITEQQESGDDEPALGLKVEFLPFASSLVHLEGLETIDRRLAGTEMSKKIDQLAKEWFTDIQETTIAENDKKPFLTKLVDLTKQMEFAESSRFSEFLTTAPLKNLALKYRHSAPVSVVLGAKGSGKTFMYMQLIRSKIWEDFIGRVDKTIPDKNTVTRVIPLLKPKNLSDDFLKELKQYLYNLHESLNLDIDLKKMNKYADSLETFESDVEAEWKRYWCKLILEVYGGKFESFEELQAYLSSRNERVVFIVDGLEEIFQNIIKSNREKVALRALCQGIVNELRAIMDNRIGFLIFIRRDLAMNAIEQNWGQFHSQYAPYELKWTNVEALRLALWVAATVNPTFAPDDIPIEKATQTVLEQRLAKLWGNKLGKVNSKEANSVNWILAALADLNEQLQARDMIRFLKHAAENSPSDDKNWGDRYLAPRAIKEAIKPCSQRKIEEISTEVATLKPIFDKLKALPPAERKIPFDIIDVNLETEEFKLLEQHGFLVKMEDGYYMPEIIRYGLGFELRRRGARPKVLKLLKQSQRQD